MGFENMFRVLNISGSGLSAERTRMNVIAHNIANANTLRGPGGGPYKKREVIFSSVYDNVRRGHGARAQVSAMGGVEVLKVVDSEAPLKRVHDPSSAFADKDGYVSMPNVNVVASMIDMVSATRAYEANLAVSKSARDMIQATLDLGR